MKSTGVENHMPNKAYQWSSQSGEEGSATMCSYHQWDQRLNTVGCCWISHSPWGQSRMVDLTLILWASFQSTGFVGVLKHHITFPNILSSESLRHKLGLWGTEGSLGARRAVSKHERHGSDGERCLVRLWQFFVPLCSFPLSSASHNLICKRITSLFSMEKNEVSWVNLKWLCVAYSVI